MIEKSSFNLLDEHAKRRWLIDLAKKPDEVNLTRLVTIAQSDESVEIRFFAKRAINAIKKSIKPRIADEKLQSIGIENVEVFLSGTIQEKLSSFQLIINRNLSYFLPQLIENLSQENEAIVLSAQIITIGKLGSDKEIRVLTPYLKHKDPRVRANTISALELIGSGRAYPHILGALSDTDNRVRGNAVVFMKKLGGIDAMKTVHQMAVSNLVSMKATAAYVLRFFPLKDNLLLLQKLFNSTNVNVRNNALATLQHYIAKGIEEASVILNQPDSKAEPAQETLDELVQEVSNSDLYKSSLNISHNKFGFMRFLTEAGLPCILLKRRNTFIFSSSSVLKCLL